MKKWRLIKKILLNTFYGLSLLFIMFVIFSKIDNLSQTAEAITLKQEIENVIEKYPGTVITIGRIDNGQHDYRVYGGDQVPYTYEIGSITKTMTAVLIEEAITNGDISLDGQIDHYLPLDNHESYPTLRQLLTHTSGYPSHYFKSNMLKNLFKGDNAYYQIDRQSIMDDIEKHPKSSKKAGYSYSNFNYAVLGLILEEVYQEKYIAIVNQYLRELGLEHTSISTDHHNLSHYESFSEDDAYLPAGQVTSNVEDMLKYIDLQLNRGHAILEQGISDYPESRAIGYAWHFHEDGIIWHNGATARQNSFIGFHPESQQGIVVLINLPASNALTATDLGQRLLLALLNE